MVNAWDRAEAEAHCAAGVCVHVTPEQKIPVERHRFEELSTRNHGTLSKSSLEVDKGNVGRLIKFLRLFDDLTNSANNIFGIRQIIEHNYYVRCTSYSSEASVFTMTVVVECWSDALQEEYCK